MIKMSNKLRREVRRLRERVIDAKAEIAVLFFARDLPPGRHDQAGHADRALRDVLEALEDVIAAATGDDGQLTLAV